MITKNFTIDLADNSLSYSGGDNVEKWKVTLVDTGIDTLKGGSGNDGLFGGGDGKSH